MNKKEIDILLDIYSKMNKAKNYLNNINGFCIKIEEKNINSSDYKIINSQFDFGLPIYIRSVDHFIGNEFCNFYNGIEELKYFIELQLNKKG